MDKEELKSIGIFASIAIILFLILFFVNIPVQKVKNAGLARQIQYILNTAESGMYTVNESVLINTSLQNIATAYRLEVNSSEVEKNATYACILRITGVCGPVPAVFLYNTDFGAKFVGIAGLQSEIMTMEKSGITDIQISYWKEQIDTLFSTDDLQEVRK